VVEALFWAFLLLTFYAYVGYPVIIYMLSGLLGRDPVPPSPAVVPDAVPSVTLLIAAYNEQAVIAERLENATKADYPKDRYAVLVASDGSSDHTAEIVRRYEPLGVRLLDYKARRGKSAVLNAAIEGIESDLVVLSDANTDIDPDAIRQLSRWFADPSVGVVCGRLVLTDAATGTNADGVYWKYETFLKTCEARLGALLGSNGAIYAIRRSLYVPIPNDTIVDDFVIPLLAKLRRAFSIIYDTDAVAREETAADVAAEFRRRSRIGAGGFQAIALLWPLLSPRYGWVSFAFLSHKVLRWACPFFLIGAFVFNVFLVAADAIYGPLLLAQIAFYGVSLVGMALPRVQRLIKPIRLATLFTGMNAALLVGFWRWVRNTQRAAWDRTSRLADVAK